jgi:hypothetical protein
MIHNNLFLFLNLRPRLNDSITISTSIFGKPLIHVTVSQGRVVQVVIHPRQALLMVPHEYGEKAGLS